MMPNMNQPQIPQQMQGGQMQNQQQQQMMTMRQSPCQAWHDQSDPNLTLNLTLNLAIPITLTLTLTLTHYNSADNAYHLFRLLPDLQYLQYYREDCQSLAVTIGGLGSNKQLRISTSKKKLEIWSLTKSDLSLIMTFLSDDWEGQFLESVGQRGLQLKFFKTLQTREDVRALTNLEFGGKSLTGEYIVFLFS
jgi:hypothetical protein